MSEGRPTGRLLATVSAGGVIGLVEVVLAISFAALVFGGYLEDSLPAGIGIYLVVASLTLAILAWRAGVRGVVGSVQDAAAAVLCNRRRERGLGHGRGRGPGLPHRRRGDPGRDAPDRVDVPAARNLPAGQPRAVHPLSGRRRLPRGHRMAADEGRSPGRGQHEPGAGYDQPVRGPVRAGPLGTGPRVRCGPAGCDPGREEAARDPGRHRPRARRCSRSGCSSRGHRSRRREMDCGCWDRSPPRDSGSSGPSARSVAPTGRRCSTRLSGSSRRCSSP